MTCVLVRRFTCDSCGMAVETSTDRDTRKEAVELLKWREHWVGDPARGYQHTCAWCLENERTRSIPAGYTITETPFGNFRFSVTNPEGVTLLGRGAYPTREAAIDFCIKDAAKVVTVVDGTRIVTPAGGVTTRQLTANSTFGKE